MNTRNKLAERRRYIRLEAPIDVTYTILDAPRIHNTMGKNISADGIRFETHDRLLKESSAIELRLTVSGATGPVHVKGIVIWKRRLSLEDAAPFDVGVEFTEIEESNKNTFLKYLCDLMYNLPKEKKHGAI